MRACTASTPDGDEGNKMVGKKKRRRVEDRIHRRKAVDAATGYKLCNQLSSSHEEPLQPGEIENSSINHHGGHVIFFIGFPAPNSNSQPLFLFLFLLIGFVESGVSGS